MTERSGEAYRRPHQFFCCLRERGADVTAAGSFRAIVTNLIAHLQTATSKNTDNYHGSCRESRWYGCLC